MKNYSLGDFLKDINTEKKNICREDEQSLKEFPPYLVRRNLSNFLDCIFYVHELNKNHNMDSLMQYDYLIHGIRKRKRFAKTVKPEKENDVELIKRYYLLNHEKANDAYSLMSENDLQHIRDQFKSGGN